MIRARSRIYNSFISASYLRANLFLEVFHP